MGVEVNTSIRKQYLISACLYIGQFAAGYTMGWTAPVLPKLRDLDETPLGRVITDPEAAWITSITFIGLVGGPYISGYLSNVVGRKPCLCFSGAVLVLSYTLLAVAKSLILMYFARAIVGVGLGVLFITNLVYIGEMASARVRGTLLTMTGFSSSLGIMTVYSVGPYISYAAINWIFVALGFVYFAVIFFLVPETAVFHVMKGRREEAMANLRSLGRQDDIDEVVAQANDKPKPKMAQLTEMYTVKTNRKAAYIIISLNILGQFSGMMIIIAFVTVIFELTGSTMESHISTIIIGATQVFASVIAPVLVDKTGRKILLLASCAACSLSLFSLGTYFYLYNSGHALADDLQWLPLVSVMVLCVAYHSGLGIIPCAFIGEMFTDTCRSFGSTFTVTIGWLSGFGMSTAFGYMLPAWGPSIIFWMYSSVTAFTFFFTIVFVPETKGKSLLEIQELLSK